MTPFDLSEASYKVAPCIKSDAFLQSDASCKVTPLGRSDAFLTVVTHLTDVTAGTDVTHFFRCDTFYGLYMPSIPLPELNLFVDCM